MNLSGKTAVITGAANGIGRAAAQTFIDSGAKVILVDLDADELERTAYDIGVNDEDCVVADVSSVEGVARFMDRVESRHGGFDVFVANAGIGGAVARLADYPLDVFDRVMSVNVRSVWLGLQASYPVMAARGGGSIIVTSSTAGLHGVRLSAAYAASKHAVLGLVRSAALEFGAAGIRVNAVHPGLIQTRMLEGIQGSRGDDPGSGGVDAVQQQSLAKVPLGRFGQPDDVAQLMLFLASDSSGYCSGGSYVVDGGRSA